MPASTFMSVDLPAVGTDESDAITVLDVDDHILEEDIGRIGLGQDFGPRSVLMTVRRETPRG